MPQIRPVSDLRNNFAEISKIVHESREPVFLTKNGYGDMVVMSIEQYEKIQLENDIFIKLKEAELELEPPMQGIATRRFSEKQGSRLPVEKKYKLRYLELAQSDLLDIISYISNQLSAPQAATNLLNKLDKEISRLERFPLSGHPYTNKQKLNEEYRMLVVENYLVFYVVYDNIVEIRRIIYGRRNYENLL